MNDIEFITIDADAQLPRKVAEQLGKKLYIAELQTFSDGEMYLALPNKDIWHNKKAIIVQSTGNPVNERILQVSFLAHELKNAGADLVIAVIPYFGYSRQEKSVIKGKFGPAEVVAHMYQGAGIDRMMMVELHTPVLESFFVIPTHDIKVDDLIAHHIKATFNLDEPLCLIAPDEGAQKRIAAIAQKLNCSFNVFQKERYDVNKTRIVGQKGACSATRAIMIDDIIDTGGTAMQAADQLLQQGFSEVYGYFVHGVFSGNALERIVNSAFTKLFVSNTIEQEKSVEKVELFDVSYQIVQAIKDYL